MRQIHCDRCDRTAALENADFVVVKFFAFIGGTEIKKLDLCSNCAAIIIQATTPPPRQV